MTFQKGEKPWNKGLRGIVKAWNKGKTKKDFPQLSNSGSKKGSITWMKGKKHRPESIEKMRTVKKGKHFSLKTEFKKGQNKGQNNWNYIDGRSYNKSPLRYGDDWDKIRYLVYMRDHFTCQKCGIKGIRLDVHHKIPFLISFDNSLNNLVALCRPCHRKIEGLINKKYKEEIKNGTY